MPSNADPIREGHAQRLQHRALALSVVVGWILLVVKTTAYALTGSAAVLSDAAESVVHVLATSFAYFSLRLAQHSPTLRYPYGFDRITFFSAGLEGGLIVLAALYILWEAALGALKQRQPEQLGVGSLLTASVIVVNGLLGLYLIRLGKKTQNLIVEADGNHVFSDSITSLGALAGLLLVLVTGQWWFDPLLAAVVALNILKEGYKLVQRSVFGLMDGVDPHISQRVTAVVEEFCRLNHLGFHDLRCRNSGSILWVQVHLLFDDHVLLRDAHALATALEDHLRSVFGSCQVITHLEIQGDHQAIHQDCHAGCE